MAALLSLGCCACNAKKDTVEPDSTQISEENNNSSANTENNDGTEEVVPVEDVTVDVKTPYANVNHSIKFLGLRQYDSFSGDLTNDTPAEGNVYLVLFLKLGNNTKESYYFSPDYVTADVDGTEIQNTFLVNDPEEYTTIFGDVEGGLERNGFIVWEVPKNWQTLNFDYTGWELMDNVRLHASFTPDDLFGPVDEDENITIE